MASTPCAGLTAYEMVLKSQLETRYKLNKNTSVLIAGASGGVGSFLTQICLSILQSNKNVYVTAGSPKSIDYCVKKLGVLKENIINYREFKGDVDAMVNHVKKLNNGRLIDCTFDKFSN